MQCEIVRYGERGSITQVSDKLGNLAAEYSYDAWGRMRNVTNWQPYAVGTEPELRFGRGYTGHEHLNQFGLINMNARLYDPVLGRFLAPDPLVASPDESNGYNRYMYCNNNPLMFTDLNGMSFKSWWVRNIRDPFKREWEHVFGGGQGGFQIGYNSAGGFFTNATYNGASFGPSAYYSNGQVTYGNGSGGFHDNSSSVRLDKKIAGSVLNAEQLAKAKMQVNDIMSRIWNEILDVPNVLFGNNEDYNYIPAPYYSKEFLSAMGQSTSLVGGYIEHSKGGGRLSAFESDIVKYGKAVDKIKIGENFHRVINNPSSENSINLGLDIISNKSFTLGWFLFWGSDIAPWAIKEINQEGYRSRDKRQLLEEQY